MSSSGTPISRRTVAAGAAWTTPAPAIAASGGGTTECPAEVPGLAIFTRAATGAPTNMSFRVVNDLGLWITLTPVSVSLSDGTILTTEFFGDGGAPLTQATWDPGYTGWIDVDTQVPMSDYYSTGVLFSFTITWNPENTPTCSYVYDSLTRTITLG